jgi:hypothetical protein
MKENYFVIVLLNQSSYTRNELMDDHESFGEEKGIEGKSAHYDIAECQLS